MKKQVKPKPRVRSKPKIKIEYRNIYRYAPSPNVVVETKPELYGLHWNEPPLQLRITMQPLRHFLRRPVLLPRFLSAVVKRFFWLTQRTKIVAELYEIERNMRRNVMGGPGSPGTGYWADLKMQARYRTLIDRYVVATGNRWRG